MKKNNAFITQKIPGLLAALTALGAFAKKQAYAAIENPAIGNLGTEEGAADGSKFISYMVSLWRVVINLGALAVLAFFLIGAFTWITAGSDSKKVENARNYMMNAVIGLVILVAGFTIIGFLSRLLFGDDFNLLRLTLPSNISDVVDGGSAGGGGGGGGRPTYNMR